MLFLAGAEEHGSDGEHGAAAEHQESAEQVGAREVVYKGARGGLG